MTESYNIGKTLKEYRKAQDALKQMGLSYYFDHANENGTRAHQIQQAIAKTSSIIIYDMKHSNVK